MNDLLEWAAFLVGTIGTLVWAVGWKWHGRQIEGWFWLVSAMLWIVFAAINRHAGLAARDLIGVALYVMGIVKTFPQNQKLETKPVNDRVPDPNCQVCKGSGVHQLYRPGSSVCSCVQKTR